MKKLRTESTDTGVKVFFGDVHVKTIPERFQKVIRKKHIINPTVKRLTREERFKLEVAIFEEDLRIKEPRVYDVIKRSYPLKVRKVHVIRGFDYYELVYKNKKGIRAGINLFKLSPIQENINRNN